MSKTNKIIPVDFEKAVMSKVKSNQITMKPRWIFVLGSVLMILGLIGLSIGAVFLMNIVFFMLRKHGPMGQWRLEMILQSFSWWIPVLAVSFVSFGIWLSKKYDFSYKKNFPIIIVGFIVSILLAAFVIDYLGLNEMWSQKGPMHKFYQQIERSGSPVPKGRGPIRNLQ